MKEDLRMQMDKWGQRALTAMPNMIISLVINMVIFLGWQKLEIVQYGDIMNSLEDNIIGLIMIWITYVAVKYYRIHYKEGKYAKYIQDLADAIRSCK